jgi:hypothetical protein
VAVAAVVVVAVVAGDLTEMGLAGEVTSKRPVGSRTATTERMTGTVWCLMSQTMVEVGGVVEAGAPLDATTTVDALARHPAGTASMTVMIAASAAGAEVGARIGTVTVAGEMSGSGIGGAKA